MGLVAGWIGRLSGKKWSVRGKGGVGEGREEEEREGRRTGEAPDGGMCIFMSFVLQGDEGRRAQ